MFFRQRLGAQLSSAATALVLAAIATVDANGQERQPNIAATWSAPTASVVSIEKKFRNGSVELSGTLYVPDATGRVPAMVVLHDASVPSQDAALYRHLIQMLPPLGIAVFIFDRRGTGKSGGSPANNGFDLLADDGLAARRMLALDRRIDPKRVGFWGLSQGGWLSLLAATRDPEAAFAISISAPMTTPDVQMNFAVANILRIKGYSQADIDVAMSARKAVDDFARGQLDRATAQQRLDEAVAKPWFELTYMNTVLQDPETSGWAKEMRLDPLKTLGYLKTPALVIFGSADPWIPVKISADALRARAKNHPNVTTVVVAGADHRMMLSSPLSAQIDPSSLIEKSPDSPEYFGIITSWLTRQGFARVGRL